MGYALPNQAWGYMAVPPWRFARNWSVGILGMGMERGYRKGRQGMTLDARIVALRKAGKSCAETARECGTKEWRVWRAMGNANLSGKISVYRLDGDPEIPRKPGPDSRTVSDGDQAMLDAAELLDISAWMQTARLNLLGWEGRKPESYLSRMDRLMEIARRMTDDKQV